MYIYMDIVEQFKCEMCGKCCSNAWLVTIDEASYQRNLAWFTERGRITEFYQAFKVLEKDKSPGEFACINKKRESRCWFLENDQCCQLHKEAGHSHLDAVCQTFPRYPMNTARGIELTLSFACPAVIRLVERWEPLRIVRSEHLPIFLLPDNYVDQVFPRQVMQGDPLRYYFEIEQHLIDILQSRLLPLEERLNLLAQTVERMIGLNGAEEQGRLLNQLFYENYTALDKLEMESEQVGISADILIEHFLVNLVFKKIFYIYGLEQANQLLQGFFQQIRLASANICESSQGLAQVKAAIMDVEFQFGHNRREALQVRKRGITCYQKMP